MNEPLPAEFVRMIERLHAPGLAGLLQALDTPASTAVRVNALKGCAVPPGADAVPWCPTGYYLEVRPQFTLDPAMHQGLYYVQEASSMAHRMAVGHAVGLLTAAGAGPLAMLDACAAPGGKTTAAIEMLPPGSVTVANEMIPQRCQVLMENLIKHGSPDIVVTRGDAALIGKCGPVFDIIAVDAPCSGEGMMRREPVARTQWSPALVRECAATQQRLTDALWQALRPGGFMVYSTCTFNRDENEAIVERMVNLHGAVSVEIPVLPGWHIATAIDSTQHCLRFIPGLLRGEGLFLALLHKPGDAAPATARSRKRRAPRGGAKLPDIAAGWIAPDGMAETERLVGAHRTGPDGATVVSVASEATAAMAAMLGTVTRVMMAGVDVACMRGKSVVPAHALAMSTLLRRGAFAEAEIDRPTALDYLRRQAVTLPEDTPRGHVLLTTGGHPLGFANNLGSRANNLYPAQWRILTTHN